MDNLNLREKVSRACTSKDLLVHLGPWKPETAEDVPTWEQLRKAALWTETRWDELREALRHPRPRPQDVVDTAGEVGTVAVPAATKEHAAGDVVVYKTGGAIPHAALEKKVRLVVIVVGPDTGTGRLLWFGRGLCSVRGIPGGIRMCELK